MNETKIPDNLLQKTKKQHLSFKLTHLYKYKFSANLSNIAVNLVNFLFQFKRRLYETIIYKV